MAQPSAPLRSLPPGEDDEGADFNNVNLIKNESIQSEHLHHGNGATIIEPNNRIPLQKINNSSMDENNQTPTLESSADDDDAVMEDAAPSGKPSSSGEAHVEQRGASPNEDTAAVRSNAAAAVIGASAASTNSNNNEGVPIQNHPLAATNAATPDLQSPSADGADGGDERKQKILASIQHRRQLLAWVRESRIACEKIRNNTSSGTKKGFVAALLEEHATEVDGNKSITQKEGAAMKTSSSSGKTSADEIADYKKVSKLANSTTLQRKKSTSTITETTAQRDLRRGSNIGKRMSAAVTTLNNFGNVGGWASTDTSISGDMPTSSSAVVPNNVASSTAANNHANSSPNKAAYPPSVGKQFNAAAAQSSSLSSKITAEKLSKKARKRASQIKKTGGISADASSTNIAGSVVPKNANAVTSTENFTQYLTLSASAVRLRDRRDELAQKLSNLLQKQYTTSGGEKRKADFGEKSPFTPRKRTKDVRTKVTQSSLTKLLSLSEMGMAKEASRLPPRRMTQWDCVLEEMRWMASDFIEERKWKVACGKSLSSSVKQHVVAQKLAAKATTGKSKNTPNKTDDTSAATETPSSSSKPISIKSNKSVDSKSSDRRKMSISDSNPLYVGPSNDDVEHSRKISQLLSITVSDHWDVALRKGAFPLTDDSYVAGYERFRKVRGELLGETSEITVQSRNNDSNPRAPPTFQELQFDEISKKIQESVKAINSLKAKIEDALSKERALQKYRKSLTSGVELSNAQLKALHFIESVWENREEFSVAAVLGGNLGIGKTIVGCFTLWKNRHAGPQLVLCSPATLLRWRHELNKFGDLNVKVYGCGGWSFRADDIYCSAGKSDVLLCDYSSFVAMTNDKKGTSSNKNNPDFVSLILDCRHPSVKNENNGKHPVEIESAEWWIRLVQFIMRFSSINRVVIEHPWNQICPANSYEGDKTTLDCKMIAMKLAFMYNPATFYSTRGSIGKRVISWAKRQDGFDCECPPLVTLRSVLATSVRKVYDSALICIKADELCPEIIRAGNGTGAPTVPKISWEIRKCSLATSQQIEYDQLCSNNVFSLFPGESSKTEIADALLLLRKVCFHANMGYFTTTLLDPLLHVHGNRNRSVVGSMIARMSTHMSDALFSAANSLLEKSSKLKELLHILTKECGHEVPSELIQSSPKDLDPNATSKKRAKVIILATLTEAQLMTSYLLSAVGLHHEVLLSFQKKGASSPAIDASTWAWSQNVISQFNDGCFTEGNHPRRFFDILVASPITLSSHCCGIGANSADFVISIDEDWSGREELHVVSLLSKIRANEKGISNSSKSPCKFVKIVSKSTCEDTFICKGNTIRVDATMPEHAVEKVSNAKKTRKRGRNNSKKSIDEIEKATVAPTNNSIEYQVCLGHSIPIRPNTAMNDDGFLLPAVIDQASNTSVVGSNILRHRNSSLSDVFCTQMGSGELFMPKDDKEELSLSSCSADHVQFSLAICQSEHEAFHSSLPQVMLRSITLSTSCPPHLQLQLRDVLSNKDVFSAPVRCFVASLSNIKSPILPERRQEMQIFQSDKADTSVAKEEMITPESAQNRETCDESEIEAEFVDGSTLLVYELHPDKLSEIDAIASRKRKIDLANDDLTTNIFSSFFDLSDTSIEFARDGHRRLEAAVYAPSFLPPLLDIARSTVVEAITIPQDSRDLLETSTKFFTNTSTMSQLNILPCASAAQTKQNVTAFGQSELSSDIHSFEMETNPYSFPVISNDENVDTLFGNSLAGCDAKGAISCQSWPSLNAMILFTEKKNENALGEKEKKEKKAKNYHLSSKSSTAGDKLSMPYLRKEKIMRRALSATKKVKFDDAASIVVSVRLRSRLSDIVTGSSTLPSSSNNTFAEHDGGNRNMRSSSGINLPIGVKAPAISSRLSTSLEETPEPWTKKEDILLKQTLARYGLNWQLASHAISAASTSRRSPSQCRHRWGSLIDSQHALSVNAITINQTNDAKMIMRFSSKPGSIQSESLIHIEPCHASDLKHGSDQRAAFHRTGNPSSSVTTTNPGPGVNKEHIASRIAKLRDTAKRRRVVPIPLPGATTTGTEINVRLASIHPSHAESVHIARSDMSHGVAPPRQEMWPLELLDFVEKQRKLVSEQNSLGSTNSQPSHHQSYPPQPQPQPPPHTTTYHPSYPYRPHQQPTTSHEKPPSTKGPS